MTKYSSPYPSEVVYRSDKNFIVRLKVMIDRSMKEAGYSTGSEQFKDLIESFDNAEEYLFDQSPDPTPSGAEVEKSLREQIDEAHIGLAHFLTDNVSTHIREGFNGWQAGFTVQQQTFYLQPVSADKGDEGDTEEKARWYQTCLETALSKIINNEYDVIDDMVSEQKRWLGELTPSGAEVYRKALEKIADKSRELLPERFNVDDKLLSAIYTILHTAREALSHSSQGEEAKGEDWISVDKPPKKRIRVIGWPDVGGYDIVHVDLDGQWKTDDGVPVKYPIIKWQPLPKPPRDHPGLDHRGAEQI